MWSQLGYENGYVIEGGRKSLLRPRQELEGDSQVKEWTTVTR
jgi:hypothetical protein